MRITKLGVRCPFCGNKSRTRIRRARRQHWLPFSQYYKCNWCYEPYHVILRIISTGQK